MKKRVTVVSCMLSAAILLSSCGGNGTVSSEKAVSSAISLEASSSDTTTQSQPVSSVESLPEASAAAASSKAASSKKSVSSAPAKPAEPSKPANIVAINPYRVSYEAEDNWYLDASGALYTFTGEKRTYSYQEGYEYKAAKQVESGVAVYRNYSSELDYKIDKKGVLYARGRLPKNNAYNNDFGLTTDTASAFINSNVYTEKNWKKIMENVADVQWGFILDKKGDLYVYGAIQMRVIGDRYVAEVCATPKKLRGNVKQICGAGGCNSVTVLTKDDKLITLGDLGEHDVEETYTLSLERPLQTETLIADNVRAAEKDAPCYYITNKNELYFWGSIVTAGETYQPKKIADNVKAADVSFYGYSYLTTDNQLYTFGDQASDTDITKPRLVAKNVKSFAFDGTLLYIDAQNQLHGYGRNNYEIRGAMGEIKELDNIILKDVARVILGYDYALAQQFDGSIYLWGNNHISCRPAGEDNDYFNLNIILKPTKVN